jgi:predicted nucleic acid-binding protein
VIHLDSSFLIGALVPGSRQDRAAREWLKRGEEFGISAVAWTEFLCGPLTAEQRDLATRLVLSRVPLREQEAEMAAGLFDETGRRRGTLVDCMIAATAISDDARLATDNTTDFRRFLSFGLRLAD